MFSWWLKLDGRWQARSLTLDALWEVEARLSAAQVHDYLMALVGATTDIAVIAQAVHATAEQKIKALAQVLR